MTNLRPDRQTGTALQPREPTIVTIKADPACAAIPNSPGGGGVRLARRLGLFDASMIVMSGIIGSGIFINPYVVATQVHTPMLIVGAWLLGGAIAMAGAFIYAELAALRPGVGGQYAYIRDAYHPIVAFVYGWALLLVTQTGGMAAVAITFARYFLIVTNVPMTDRLVATLALALLTLINCLGVRIGATTQNVLMLLKLLAIAALVVCGLFVVGKPMMMAPVTDRPISFGLLAAMGAAMTPVMFAYGGWQTASFVGGEFQNPRRDLPRGILIGVSGVVLLYVSVSYICVRALGAAGLSETTTPASSVMRLALGRPGATIIAVGIAISTLGFLSQSMLTAPRVYFAMARDKLFFKQVGWIHPTTRVPVIAITLQGILAVVIALTGKYEQILNYVVSVDFIWFGLTAGAIFIFRRQLRQSQSASRAPIISSARGPARGPDNEAATKTMGIPGHPVTTALFIVASGLIVTGTIYKYPSNSAVGLTIVAMGFLAYFAWRRKGLK